jgi:hypothetical protein
MTRTSAEQYLLSNFPDLPHAERDRLVALALDEATLPTGRPDVGESSSGTSPDKVRVSVHDPNRRRFLALAWLAGASWNQLATLYGVARQTLMDQMNRVLPEHERARYKDLRGKLKYSQLHGMREIYNKNPTPYGGTDLWEASQILVEDSADYDD